MQIAIPIHAAEGIGHAKAAAGLEVALFQMLKFAPWLMLGMAGQMNLAVFRDDRAALVHQNGGVVAPGDAGLDRQLGIAEVKPDTDLAREVE
ncbi:hypothetical protein BRDID11002_70910 [Bradyrhizobium diazoefficiens]